LLCEVHYFIIPGDTGSKKSKESIAEGLCCKATKCGLLLHSLVSTEITNIHHVSLCFCCWLQLCIQDTSTFDKDKVLFKDTEGTQFF
jgi:hypothetical protein